jgi:hypothetical protein
MSEDEISRRIAAAIKPFQAKIAGLERRAQHDDERWQSAAADFRAISFLIDAMAVAVCSVQPSVISPFLESLVLFEAEAKMLNAPDAMISRVRATRAFLEQKVRSASPEQ